ncbi:MAG: HAMP domain-containing sensor histidine kinase [Caulobacterales bacterium]
MNKAAQPPAPRSWTGRNFALVAIILVIATLGAALAFADRSTESIVLKSEREATSDELDALVAIANEDGSEVLREALELRTRLTTEHFIHLLVNSSGERVVGDMDSWPDELTRDGVWTRFEFKRIGQKPEFAYGLAQSLPDGSRLMIARDVEALKRVRSQALQAFGLALFFAVGVALALGYALDRLVLARVRTFADTAESVMAGRLSARVPVGNERDELAGLARTLNLMLDRVETLMMGLRAVTDSLAHDLRTPLTRLAAAVETAQQGQQAERPAALATAHSEAQRIKQTFETLIDIARAETGLSREAMSETNLAELVDDIADLFTPLAEDKEIALRCTTEPVMMLAHRALVAQAFGNLVDNAIKYTAGGGAIDITLSTADGGADIIVADNGPGIPADQRTAAVARFQRLARDSTIPGAGLGLSIVAAAAHLHGGRLRLEDNQPGLIAVLELRSAV